MSAAAAPKEAVANSAEAVAAGSGREEDVRARLEGVAALASSIQPTGSTLATTQVLTRVRAPAGFDRAHKQLFCVLARLCLRW